jgi:hypothetical protein
LLGESLRLLGSEFDGGRVPTLGQVEHGIGGELAGAGKGDARRQGELSRPAVEAIADGVGRAPTRLHDHVKAFSVRDLAPCRPRLQIANSNIRQALGHVHSPVALLRIVRRRCFVGALRSVWVTAG